VNTKGKGLLRFEDAKINAALLTCPIKEGKNLDATKKNYSSDNFFSTKPKQEQGMCSSDELFAGHVLAHVMARFLKVQRA